MNRSPPEIGFPLLELCFCLLGQNYFISQIFKCYIIFHLPEKLRAVVFLLILTRVIMLVGQLLLTDG